MRIKVLLFGPLAEAAGQAETTVELPPGSRVADVPRALGDPGGAGAGLPGVAFAVNAAYVRPEHPLADGDEVALIPPVSGG